MTCSFWRTTILLVLLVAPTVWADSIYRWVDKEGRVHYSDQAPADDRVEGTVETRPAVPDSGSPAAAGAAGSTPPATTTPSRATLDRKDVDVEIYTTSWCHYCRKAKQYFRTRGISFKAYDVEKDARAARRLRRYNPRGGVPVTVIDGRPIVGYAPDAFSRALQAP
mgnify:CR=1 FL=1